MSGIRDLMFQQDNLDVLLKKFGYTEQHSIIPWESGFAILDHSGNIISYIKIDANGNLVFQDTTFSTINKVSSVSDNQFQVFEKGDHTGTLFTFPDSKYEGLDFFMSTKKNNDIPELVSQVTEVDFDVTSSLLDLKELLDLL